MQSAPAKQPSIQQPQRNPISLRLYKILGTKYTDDATIEALQTLSDLYYTPVQTPGKAKEKEKDLDGLDEGEDSDIAEDADLASPTKPAKSDQIFRENVPGETAMRARKNLQRDMELKLAEGSRQFLNALEEVVQKLDGLQEKIKSMRRQCDEAESLLQTSGTASTTLLENARNLREQRQDIEARKSIVSLFLSRFTLSDSEVEALNSRDVPVGQRFFDAMDRTERIRSDCRMLMSGEDGPSQVGLDIMAVTSTQLESAYEKILRWCSFEFRELKKEVQVEVDPTMTEAVRRLRHRPELLSEALAVLSRTRHTTLHRAFLTALTRGPPRPIELHAHDPLRYIGDMLAWVHQAIAAEREFLEALFSLKEDGRMVGSVRTWDGKREEEERMGELMDGAVGGFCGPLKARVQQVVRSQESSIILYKIANLLQFYGLTMRRTLGGEAFLSRTIKELTDIAYKAFMDSIEAQGRALLRVSLDLDESEVKPPQAILDHAQILREILSVYASALGDSVSIYHAEPVDEAAFEHILDVMVEPALQMCDAAAEEKKRVRGRWDREVFSLNCLTYLQGVLGPFEFTKKTSDAIQMLIDQRTEELTDQHYETILKDSGLEEAVVACESREKDDVLSRHPSTEPTRLQVSLRKFSLWLSRPELVHSPRLSGLSAQRLHTQIHQAALGRLAGAYETVCVEVRRPENRYEAGSTLLGSERPFGQVHLLWQIFGLKSVEEGLEMG